MVPHQPDHDPVSFYFKIFVCSRPLLDFSKKYRTRNTESTMSGLTLSFHVVTTSSETFAWQLSGGGRNLLFGLELL